MFPTGRYGPTMHWGYFTHVAGTGRPAEVYRETIELAIAAEGLGFGSFWIAQHHGDEAAGWLPSPLVLLAAVAQHTSTIRLGTAVVAVPLENIARLAEDASVLDALSGGRLELGLGVGSSAAASVRFGLDHAARHAAAVRAIDELCDLLTGDALVPPAAGLRGRLWWATGHSASVDAAAARGIGVISGRPADPPVPDDLARYWARAVDEPRVAVSRLVTGSDRADGLARRWADDPAVAWASELITQTVPAGRPVAEQLAVMRRLAGEVRPALHTALAARRELIRA